MGACFEVSEFCSLIRSSCSRQAAEVLLGPLLTRGAKFMKFTVM
jgi:hypothetical protein